jgi:ubiquitin carboxyl-terminal hydrolase 36/42
VFPNRDKECSFCVLEWQIARILHVEAGALESPGKIIRCLPLFAEHFRWGRQEDAHEFLRYIVDACQTAGLRIHKRHSVASANGNCGDEEGRGHGSCMVMRETFGGTLLSQVKCLVCKGESNKIDEIMDISLDLPGSSSVDDALACFFKPEILEGANKCSCERYVYVAA